MAVAKVAHFENTVTGSATPTVSSVVGTGGNLLLVKIGVRDNDPGFLDVTGVTHGSDALTHLYTTADGASAGRYQSFWYRFNPGGSATVTVTLENAPPGHVHLMAEVFSGVDVSSEANAFGTPDYVGTAGGTSLSASPVGVADGLVTDFIFIRDLTIASLAADGGQLNEEDQEATYTSGSSTKTGTGTLAMGWSWGSSINAGLVAIPLKPSGGGGGGDSLVWAPVTRIVRGPSVQIVSSGFTPGQTVS